MVLTNEKMLRSLVSKKEWKSDFISLIDSLSGFDRLTKDSIANDGFCMSDLIEDLKYDSEKIIDRYDKKELVVARHYYNNSHLIKFWRWHCLRIDNCCSHWMSLKTFPVFSIVKESDSGRVRLVPIKAADFEKYFYWKTSDHPAVYHLCKLTEMDKYKHIWSVCEHDSLEQIMGRLTLLCSKWKECTTHFYRDFLNQQLVSNSSTWSDYKIHYFLDLYLYTSSGEQNLGANFDNIFFSNNLVEIGVFLRYFLKKEIDLHIEDISDFLKRQRKYYVQLALTIDHEENAFLNNYRGLMYYDPDLEIVVMPELNDERRASMHHSLIVEAGIMKSDGCPFARSKGVSDNAVLELFTWFDNLMLQLVKRWLDYPCHWP